MSADVCMCKSLMVQHVRTGSERTGGCGGWDSQREKIDTSIDTD